jgi:cytochrome c oxidase cbb3-type subunit 3
MTTMPRRTFTLACALLCALTAACDRALQDNATTAALPAVSYPVGPVPGPGGQPAAARNPYGEDRAALQEGRRLFVRFNCSGCHGGHAGGGMGPSLRDATWIYGSSSADIFGSIAQGRAHGMPAWGTRLPEQEIWKLVAYIQTLRTPREADPPS